jgi:adenosylcobinamide kinase/adenosylcobinamide-phosphate guanylyltransferase
MSSILILGGARSGKSRFAVELAKKATLPVLFIATAMAGDAEMQERIIMHRRERPAEWRTLEVSENIGWHIESKAGDAGVVIVDCITMLVSNILCGQRFPDPESILLKEAETAVISEIQGLIDCIQHSKAIFILVSNEVGLGLVPSNHISRLYRDLLGKANQKLAQHADEAYFMAAGLPISIKH